MTVPEPGDGLDGLLAGLRDAPDPQDRAAAVWAAAFLADEGATARAMRDADRQVRLEAIRSFARMKGEVQEIAEALIACLRDDDVEVRREALRQAVRWTPPADWTRRFSEALADGLASGDRDVRLLASEAMSTQAPEALDLVLPMLLARDETSLAAIEALVRSGRPELFQRAREHLEMQLGQGAHLARLSARVAGAMRHLDGNEAAGYALLCIRLHDFVPRPGETGLGGLRGPHGQPSLCAIGRRRSAGPRAHGRGGA